MTDPPDGRRDDETAEAADDAAPEAPDASEAAPEDVTEEATEAPNVAGDAEAPHADEPMAAAVDTGAAAKVAKRPVKKAAKRKPAAPRSAPSKTVKTAPTAKTAKTAKSSDASQPDEPAEATARSARLSKAAKLEAEAAQLRAEQAAAEAAARTAAAQRARAARRARAAERTLDDDPDDASQGDGADGSSAVAGWRIAAIVLGALLVLTLVVGGVLTHNQVSDRNARLARSSALESARHSALTSAKSYAVDFGSYDYRHLPADFAKVTTHLTTQFAKSYKASSDGLAATIVKYRGKSTAAVQGVAVVSATTTTAEILIFLDQTVTTAQSNTPRIDRNRLQMSLVRRKGTWLIDQLMLK